MTLTPNLDLNVIMYTVSQKKVSQIVFIIIIFYKTQRILIKFGALYPE